MTDPKPCPLCESPAEKYRNEQISCSSGDCPAHAMVFSLRRWQALPRRPTVEELVEQLAKVTLETWIGLIHGYDDDGVTYYGPLNKGHCSQQEAWRAIAEELLK